MGKDFFDLESTGPGTFGKMTPNFVTLGNYKNDYATNLKICMQISVVLEIRNMQWRESISIILEITIDQNFENSLAKP